jgi:ElaB/YqjD/DUF883 family membrane-anchored ribosome-binding protein
MTHASSRTNTSSDSETIKESAVAVKDAVADLAAETGKYAQQRMNDAKEGAMAVVDTAKEKAEEYNKTVMSLIRKNPYRSVAIAAGAGLILGMLLRRR